MAVFDLDETLIRCKSMFSFLEYSLVARLGPEVGGVAYQRALAALEEDRQRLAREDVNRRFWRHFGGWRLEDLAALAQDWFRELVAKTDPFIPETLARWRGHQAAGHQTVLLSGSAEFIVAPVAQALGADAVLAIELAQQADGSASGEIKGIQTIGVGKAKALAGFLALGRQGSQVFGYGDHASDLPFLQLCDHAHCVLAAHTPLPPWALGLERVDVHLA
ncbi:MAG: HAD-IB family hydrolase [Rhodoferax sp.]